MNWRINEKYKTDPKFIDYGAYGIWRYGIIGFRCNRKR